MSLLPQDDTWRPSISPKQHPSRQQRDWYPYYAGFTEKFVENVLSSNWHDFRNVLDPWSGSGTTSAVCLRNGVKSNGLDINPALTIIARGRLVPIAKREEVRKLAKRVVDAAEGATPDPNSSDLLRLWFTDDAVCHIRSVELSIQRLCETKGGKELHNSEPLSANDLPILLSFLYTALFAAVRSVLGEFRSTNPMWIKKRSSSTQQANPSQLLICQLFCNAVEPLANLLSMPEPLIEVDNIPVTTGDSNQLPYENDTFDAAITSPPYATRLDYVNGTLPELAIIGATEQTVADLRKQVTGSPVVRQVDHADADSLPSPFANDLLEKVRTHTSKGSSNYYFPWLRNYFWNLKKGFDEIHRTVTRGGKICIVVQDSRYKELHVNLQQIVTELLSANDRPLISRIDHPARNLRFSQVEMPTIHREGSRNVESLLVYGRSTP